MVMGFKSGPTAPSLKASSSTTKPMDKVNLYTLTETNTSASGKIIELMDRANV